MCSFPFLDTNKAGGEKNIGPLDSLQSQTTTTTTTVDDGPESKNNEGEANTNDIDQDTPKPAESTATAATTMTTSDLPAAALPPSAAAESHEPSSPAEEPIKTPPPEPAAEPTSSQNQQGPREVPLPEDSIYHLKWFEWKGIQTPIITQNENGPCPLLAIANVLILARKIELPPMQQIISGKQLMEYIGEIVCFIFSVFVLLNFICFFYKKHGESVQHSFVLFRFMFSFNLKIFLNVS